MRALSISFKVTEKEVNLYYVYKNRSITFKKEVVNALRSVRHSSRHRLAGLHIARNFLFAFF